MAVFRTYLVASQHCYLLALYFSLDLFSAVLQLIYGHWSLLVQLQVLVAEELTGRVIQSTQIELSNVMFM